MIRTRLLQLLGWMILLPIAVVMAILASPFLLVALPFYVVYRIRVTTAGHPIHWLRAKFGFGRSVTHLAKLMDVPREELLRHEPIYREAFIPKRSGEMRRLLVPDDETKRLQQRLLRRVFKALLSHSAANGFEAGSSIVTNAVPHVGQAVVIQMDIVDFFPSTISLRVESYFRRIGWNREAAALLTRLTTSEEGLPQGAPTSPRLSNLVNFGLDERLSRFAKRRKGQYTRYADDITFSFPKDYPKRIRGVIQKTKRILKVYGYRMHEREKLHIRRRHQRQVVTGLVVNDGVNLPRPLRRRLRAANHHHETGRPATWTREQLQGWASLLSMIQTQRQSSPSHE